MSEDDDEHVLDETKFDLKKMLKEVEGEGKAAATGQMNQTQIADLFKKRKKQDDG